VLQILSLSTYTLEIKLIFEYGLIPILLNYSGQSAVFTYTCESLGMLEFQSMIDSKRAFVPGDQSSEFIKY
jgi:hypothetical protein